MQDLLTAVGPNAKRDGIRSQITIHKAKLKKGCLIASFREQLDNEMAGRKFENVECGDRAHTDLLNALGKLVPHFCLITKQLPHVITPTEGDEEAEQASNEELAPFSVTGISYDKAGTGFTLTGTLGAPYFIENPRGQLRHYFGQPPHEFDPCDYAGYLPADEQEAEAYT